MITKFRESHYFLSSFYEAPFVVTLWQPEHEVTVPTREHGYQASKAVNLKDWQWVLAATTPREAQKRGRLIERKPDWDRLLKKRAMFSLIGCQVTQDRELRANLLATGNELLVEGNHWHDIFWGACTCDSHLQNSHLPLHADDADGAAWVARGKNWLGRLWMMHRDLLSEELT